MQEPGGKEKVGVIIVGEPGPEEDGPPGKKRRADEVDQAVDRLGGAIDIEPETKGRAQAGDEEESEPETGPPGNSETRLVARMSVLAWFCNENFISVAAGFFHRAGAYPAITENLQCH